ncbi:MAG: TrkH family potassium uptake protein [Lachnoclostridium sp.]|nr:TrkH family potassium uptake protein [Lachnoclostridium sp.]
MAFSRNAGINFPILLRVVGWLLLIECIFLLVPLVTCLIYDENDWKWFAITIAATFVCGLGMTFIRPRRKDMAKREGFLLTALVWVAFSIFGMIPFMLMDHPLNISESFFETMSGFTTTGATVFNSISHLSHGIIIWRSVMQWIGGMGIILFTLAVIPMLNNTGGMQMFNAEVTGITHDKLRPRVSQTAKGLWIIYIILTILLFALLVIGPMKPFEAICHAFSVMSTGGFSTEDASIAAWKSDYITIVLTVFMFLGGVSFSLLFRASQGDFRAAWHNDIFRAYLRIILVVYLMFVAAIVINGQAYSIKSVTLDPLFMIVSTITSTGYVVTNFENWGTFALSLVFAMMFFGACAGSTSGGAKIDRLIYLLKYCRNEIYRCLHQNRIYSVRVNQRVIPADTVSKVVAFLCLYVLVIIIGGMLLSALGVPLVDAFFSAFSCISNTGLGAGVTGYGGSYDIIPDAGKWILSLIMLTGRLEVYTILLIFTTAFWKK